MHTHGVPFCHTMHSSLCWEMLETKKDHGGDAMRCEAMRQANQYVESSLVNGERSGLCKKEGYFLARALDGETQQ